MFALGEKRESLLLLFNPKYLYEITIYWRRSNAATKRSVRAKLEGLAFDALAGVTNAGKLLNRYVDTVGIFDENASIWSDIIHCLHNAYRWISESYYYDCLCKQLKLSIILESD